jgi:hypothetical protein
MREFLHKLKIQQYQLEVASKRLTLEAAEGAKRLRLEQT